MSIPGGGLAEQDQGQLRSRDGTRIFYRRQAARGEKTRARVLVVHGFAEHSGRYEHVLRGFSERGFDAWALDLRGFGQSDGGRGCIRRWDEYLDDVQALLECAARDRATVPVFLVGHSMGGLVSTRFCEERPSGLRGLLLSSPFFRVKMPVPAVKRAAATVLSSLVPDLALPTDMDPGLISRDPEVVKAYVEDPLVLKKATTRWFTEAMGAQARALADAPSLAMPLLVIHGAADAIADPEASRRFFELAGAQDKTLRLWPELRHEILNEPEKQEVLAAFSEWIEKRLPG